MNALRAAGSQFRPAAGLDLDRQDFIPPTGGTEDNGNLERDAEVAPDAPIDEATLDNSKAELLKDDSIFIAPKAKSCAELMAKTVGNSMTISAPALMAWIARVYLSKTAPSPR